MVIETFLENGFEATLRPKTNFLSIWKGKFSDFLQLLSEEVKITLWESKVKRQKLFKSKFGHRDFLRKWF